MYNDIAIQVVDVKKGFKIYYDKNKTLKDILARPGKGKEEKREVLQGINFEVKKGEAVALIGRNGCGKSTMLKLLTKIIYPDSGEITVKGKVSSLIELGAGFHPDMSGRENIYLNASIFGLTRKEIDAKLDEIIEFSELEKFIDNPVRTYSSGMYMRLAFSVAINVEAEVLLIDEILGVGDVSFQKKCFERLKQIKDSGTTIVIVSHSMGQIEEICDRSIWICDGVVKEAGETKSVDTHYYEYMEAERLSKSGNRVERVSQEDEKKKLPSFCDERAERKGGETVFFDEVSIHSDASSDNIWFPAGSDISIDLQIKSKLAECIVNMSVGVCGYDGTEYFIADLMSEQEELLRLRGDNKITFVLKNLNLLGGKYYINLGLYTKENEALDEIRFAKSFSIYSDYDLKEKGFIHFDHKWDMENMEVVSGD